MKKKAKELLDTDTLLQEHDFKITPLRTLLLQTLWDSSKPLPVTTLEKKVRKLQVHTSTLYRALEAFIEAGIVRELSFSKAASLYEFVHKEHMHHITCNICGTLEAIPFCVRGLESNALLKSKLFKQISGHTLSFSGTCKKCARAVR